MIIKSKLLIITGLFLVTYSTGQYAQRSEQLKLYEVRVLEANLSKKADALNIEIAQNNLNKGLAGLTPRINFTAGDDVSYTSNINESANGINRNGFRFNNAFNAALLANMTLYNGGRNRNLYERFRILTDVADLNQRQISENLIYQIRSLYYQAIRQIQLIKASETAIDYSDQRLQLATNKLDIGTGNKVEVLQAELDRNQYASDLENYKNALQNIFVQMNSLMNLPPGNLIEIPDTIFFIGNLNKAEIEASMQQQHVEIVRNRINYSLALNKLDDVKGQWKPTLDANLGYSFSRADNGGGFFRVNSSNGAVGGLTLSVPIYDGRAVRSQIKNAEVEVRQVQLQNEDLRVQLLNSLNQYYNNYQNAIELVRLQEKNLKNAQENIEIGLARFQVGVTNGFEFKQIQQSFTDANFRYIDALYQAKLNELELVYLSGQILRTID